MRTKKHTVQNPYSGGTAYKGQLHCHTTESDGQDAPNALMAAYAAADYDFVCITDHSADAQWPNVPTIPTDAAGLLHIPSAEPSYCKGDHPQGLMDDVGHLTHINATTLLTAAAKTQVNINHIVQDGGIAFIAHPNIFSMSYEYEPPGLLGEEDVRWMTTEFVNALTGYAGIEIFNASPLIGMSAWWLVVGVDWPGIPDICYAEGTLNSVNLWDKILTAGYKKWGVAVDDCHDKNGTEFNAGWVSVYAESLSIPSILHSLQTGNFYSSTGPSLDVQTIDNGIRITADSASDFYWINKNGSVSRISKNRDTSTYYLRGDEGYVRCKITRASDSKIAWTQPVFVE